MKLLLEHKDEEAMALMYEAAKTAPEGWLALSNELIKEKQYGPAEDRCKEILKLTKDARLRAAALNNLGMIYCAIGQVDSAEQVFKESIREYPNAPDSFSNLGLIGQWRQRFDESLRYVKRALRLDPWHEQAQFIQSSVKLLDGNYREGFEEYECRWRSKVNATVPANCTHEPKWATCECPTTEKKGGLQKLNTNKPEWDGTNGKFLFIYGEQGHGDSILMLRYAREIRARGMRQAWVCQKSMGAMLRHIPEIDVVVEVGDPLPDFDCHLPSVSLPRVFKTTLENIPPAPYIPLPEDAMIYPGNDFNVGICWRGNQTQTNDVLRSTNLGDWADVLAVEGVVFHSLQVDNADEGLLYPSIKTYEKPNDWHETVRRMANLDLIISVDTASVHLAGALGLPCWCALHRRPYFVYPPKCGDKTPWYDSVRLFRADETNAWKPVFKRIAQELCKTSAFTKP